MHNTLAIIGGSGFAMEDCADYVDEISAETPYGRCSAAPQIYRRGDRRLLFLARHGIPHRIPPHCVNYRANLWALRNSGCARIIAINTVGGIAPQALTSAIVSPDQIIDYTHGREHTFSDGGDMPLQHIDFTAPYSDSLRRVLSAAAAAAGVAMVDGGVYGATQGPRLETAAEINRMQRDGCDIVGMTAMPEAALARELGIEYAALCLVVNPAAGRGGAITLEEIQRVSARGMRAIEKIIAAALAA